MSETAALEASVADSIGKAMGGYSVTAAAEVVAELKTFEFDEAFQNQILALTMRDSTFMVRAGHLLDPKYFENAGDAAIMNMLLRYWNTYKACPSVPTIAELLKKDITSKVIRSDVKELAIERLKLAIGDKTALANRVFVEEQIADFVRHQAVSQAVLDSLPLIERKEWAKVEKSVRAAVEVGINVDGDNYDYFEEIKTRTSIRNDKKAGIRPPSGITTGNIKIDDVLYHKGWGRRELATIMGGAKTGKTTGLISFAKGASLAGHNVLYVTLEVSSDIIAERLDASLANVEIRKLLDHISDVDAKIKALKHGRLDIREYPTGTFSPNMLRALLERQRSNGVVYDLVVVDYADIMLPNHRTQDAIENSKSIYVDLRAIMQEFNVAGLTATQTNRAGYVATVAKAEHVADDFNKVRIVDLMISINITDEERARGEARLYFAASRNQESGFTMFVKQNLAMAQFITQLVRIE